MFSKTVEKPILENVNAAGIEKKIKDLKLNGFGGDCPWAAIEINKKIFDGEGEYIVAANKFWFNKHNRVIGHVAVKYLDRYWDSDGETTLDHLESWGMLDEHDSDYNEDTDWTPEDAYEVELLEMNEDELREIFDMESNQSLKEYIRAIIKEEFEHSFDLSIGNLVAHRNSIFDAYEHCVYRDKGSKSSGPIVVVKIDDEPGKYQLIDGYHRLIEHLLDYGGKASIQAVDNIAGADEYAVARKDRNRWEGDASKKYGNLEDLTDRRNLDEHAKKRKNERSTQSIKRTRGKV